MSTENIKVNNENEQENKSLNVGEIVSNSEKFIEKNKKIIIAIISVVVLGIAAYFLYQNFVVAPRENNVQEELFAAQKYFEQEDFKKALEGDGKFAGLLSIIEDYGSTKGGSLAHYYAGNIYLRQGDYNKAIEHLSSYKGDDIIISSQTKALIADAYVELGQLDKAISNYKDAIKSENIMTTPFVLLKLGQVYEMQKNNVEALNCYKRIKTEFPASQEYREIEKYISRLENLQ
jgi:tetratricopeptide (TPR) repeat protein